MAHIFHSLSFMAMMGTCLSKNSTSLISYLAATSRIVLYIDIYFIVKVTTGVVPCVCNRVQYIPTPFFFRVFHFPHFLFIFMLIKICWNFGSTTARTEFAERPKVESEFVEIGYICSVHGLQGEVRVKPRTDFPELRFSKVLKNPIL